MFNLIVMLESRHKQSNYLKTITVNSYQGHQWQSSYQWH